MRYTFLPRVALTSSKGDHIRYVPGALAGAMVAGGSALPASPRSVVLVSAASTQAHRIGEPTDTQALGVRFTRWRRLDASASRIVEHHPRCLW